MWTVNRDLDDSTRDAIHMAMLDYGLFPKELSCGHTICRAERVPKSLSKPLAEYIYSIAFNAIPNLLPLNERWEQKFAISNNLSHGSKQAILINGQRAH